MNRLVAYLGSAAMVVSIHYYYSSKIAAANRDLKAAQRAHLELKARVAGEREAFQQALSLATALREGDSRLQLVAARLDSAVKKLGDQHVKIDPCFYSIPDTATLSGVLSEDSPTGPP